MGKLHEIISLIPKALSRPELIIEGWTNDLKLQLKAMGIAEDSLSDEEVLEIMRRRAICEECPFMSENAKTSVEYKDLTGNNYKTSREAKHCAFCKCPITKATASLEKECGIEDWNSKNPDKQLELKWKKFKD